MNPIINAATLAGKYLVITCSSFDVDAIYTSLLLPKPHWLEPLFLWPQHQLLVNGRNMADIDEGDRAAGPVLLLSGNVAPPLWIAGAGHSFRKTPGRTSPRTLSNG
jgi:hypothetical protein